MAWCLLAAVILSAGIWVFAPTPDGPGNTPGAAPADVASTDSTCGLPAGDQTIPTTTPADTTWEIIGTMAAPINPAIGPGAVGNGLPYCYARSPMGALYAAANWLAVCTDPSLQLPAVKFLTAAGPGRDAMLAQITGPGTPGTSDLQIAGFQIGPNFAPEAATVEFAVRFGTRIVHVTVPLAWQVGDWKVVIPDTGAPFAGITDLTDLRDYVPWSGR
jgi:hypothetical protein